MPALCCQALLAASVELGWQDESHGRSRSLKLSSESARLEGGENGVEFGKMGAEAGFPALDGGDDGGEFVLEVEGLEEDIDRS